MNEKQEMEWDEAQRIVVSVDLVAAAKRQLQFLEVVDRNRWLYEGLGLQRAIYRYKACWLPMLAAHSEYRITEGPLVVPLDCEWVWHCHRINPVRYKTDCEKIYGKIIDNTYVVSSIQGASKIETEATWNRLYPEEPYELNIALAESAIPVNHHEPEKFVQYDLASAVERQRPFVYQVSRVHMNSDLFLEEAFARYKGFLYLKKRNEEQSISQFSVPTYDIDLMWHSHILHPVYYCEDTMRAIGKILEHIEEEDRTKGRRLDIGFQYTIKQWEETFGTRYSKAGAMFRGLPPKPVTNIPYKEGVRSQKVTFSEYSDLNELIAPLPEKKMVEVYIEIVGVRNLPEGHTGTGSPSVFVSKENADVFFTSKRKLGIKSVSGHKQIASFQCEPSGKLLFELVSNNSKLSKLHLSKADKPLGSLLLPLSEFLHPVSKLSTEKWFELSPPSNRPGYKPIYLRIAISFAIPTTAPIILLMVPHKPPPRSFCFFPVPELTTPYSKSLKRVQDVTGTEIVSLRMRMVRGYNVVEAITTQGVQILAKRVRNAWFIERASWTLRRANTDDEFAFELKGRKMVRLYPGRKLEYEPKCCTKEGSDGEFLTAIEFSDKSPFGKSVAVLNWKSGFLVVSESWFTLYGIILGYILSDVMKRDEAAVVHSRTLNSQDTHHVSQSIDEYFNGVSTEISEARDIMSHRNSQQGRIVPVT